MSVAPLFPFHINDATRMMVDWMRPQREFLDETYGDWVYDGRNRKSFSVYQASAIVLNKDTVVFITYAMKDSFHGGRGRETHRIEAKLPAEKLAGYIERRKFALAEDAYEKDQEARRLAAIAQIAADMYPDD